MTNGGLVGCLIAVTAVGPCMKRASSQEPPGEPPPPATIAAPPLTAPPVATDPANGPGGSASKSTTPSASAHASHPPRTTQLVVDFPKDDGSRRRFEIKGAVFATVDEDGQLDINVWSADTTPPPTCDTGRAKRSMQATLAVPDFGSRPGFFDVRDLYFARGDARTRGDSEKLNETLVDSRIEVVTFDGKAIAAVVTTRESVPGPKVSGTLVGKVCPRRSEVY